MVEREDILNLIKHRRSIRSFSERPVEDKAVNDILDAGRWAPSPSNVQSWIFGVVKDGDQLTILKNLSPGFPNSATLGIAVCSDRDRLSSFGGEEVEFLRACEAAMAVQNMLLFADSIGIGTCAVASYSRKGVSELLNLPDDVTPVLLIAAGHPDDSPDPPERTPLARITFREEYERQ